MRVEERLEELGIVLPAPPRVGGAYSATQVVGNLLFVAAQFPIAGGKPACVGRLGAEVGVEEGRKAARLAALTVLSQINAALGGFDRLKSIARMDAQFLTTPEFQEHAKVLDGASELFHEVLGKKAGHVRSLAGVSSLPLGLTVELVVVGEVV